MVFVAIMTKIDFASSNLFYYLLLRSIYISDADNLRKVPSLAIITFHYTHTCINTYKLLYLSLSITVSRKEGTVQNVSKLFGIIFLSSCTGNVSCKLCHLSDIYHTHSVMVSGGQVFRFQSAFPDFLAMPMTGCESLPFGTSYCTH